MKKQTVFAKLYKDNKGVTLVELIVAVCVLSIAIAPLLYSFVYSTRMNAQAKTKQRALNAAQTVMETFKANGLQDSYDLFQGNKKITQTDEEGNETQVSVPFLVNNETATYSVDITSGQYGQYHIENMTFSDSGTTAVNVGSDNKKYDVDISVAKGVISTDVAQLDVFDPNQDVVYQEYKKDLGSYFYDPVYVANEIVAERAYGTNEINKVTISKRTITLHLEDNKVTVSYQYKYTIDTKDDGNVSGVYDVESKKTEFIINPTNDDDPSNPYKLRSVYFYFYPAYKAYKKDATNKDVINTDFEVQMGIDVLNIDNHCSNDDVKLYVYKQADTARLSSALATADDAYELHLINARKTESDSPKLHVYDCVDDNLINIVDPSVNYHSALTNAKGMIKFGEAPGGVVGDDTHNRICVDGKYSSGAVESVDKTSTPLTTYITIRVYDRAKDPDHNKPIATLSSTILN